MATKKATRRDALACCYMAWVRFKTERFKISRQSKNFAALQQAQAEGWVWFPCPQSAVLTVDGLKALGDYGVPPP